MHLEGYPFQWTQTTFHKQQIAETEHMIHVNATGICQA